MPDRFAPDDIARLLQIMARLRAPVGGCPWDIEQTYDSIAPYTIEEAYEVADAIARGDRNDLREELGDLLLQVVYHARIAEEEGAFAFGDVVTAISDKMIRRHPHVFGADVVEGAAAQTGRWEAIKAAERAAKGACDAPASALDDIPLALPALTRAEKMQNRAARIGFDWDSPEPILAKIAEESAELAEARDQGHARMMDEYGDLLFVVVNLGRKLGLDPEEALRGTNRKFDRRFRHIERGLAARDLAPEQATLAQMEALWDEAKRAEKAAGE